MIPINQDEVQRLLDELNAAGLDAELCDTFIPFYKDNPVMCGIPSPVGDVVADYFPVPYSLSYEGEIYRIVARGDSMSGMDIQEGDALTVMAGVTFHDGDIVLAYIDNNYTIKAYFEDQKGRKWLLPCNDKHKPILLNENMDVRIRGVIIEIGKKNPHLRFRECEKILRKAEMEEASPQRLTSEQIDGIICKFAPLIKAKRQWYAVFRPMVDKEYEKRGIYDGFCERVANLVPNHKFLPTPLQMQRVAILSFDKQVKLWDKNNAPVTGKRFDKYLGIAQMVMEMLVV